MHHPLRLTVDRSAIQVELALACRARRGSRRCGGQGRRLWTWRARDGRSAARSRLPRLLRLDLGRSRGARELCPETSASSSFTVSAPTTSKQRSRFLARPCLNTAEQVARWKEIAPGRPCDVMIDTGMNRLGLQADGDRRCSTASRSTRCTAISPAPTRTAR